MREHAGISKSKLARLTGVTRSAVTRWENGENGIKGKYLLRLAEILNVNPKEILPQEKELLQDEQNDRTCT